MHWNVAVDNILLFLSFDFENTPDVAGLCKKLISSQCNYLTDTQTCINAYGKHGFVPGCRKQLENILDLFRA